MSPVSVQALRTLAEVKPLRATLDALNLQSRRPCAFSTFEYIETFLTHDEFQAAGEELLFLVAFDGARSMIGYLPLRKSRERVLGLVPFTRVGVLVNHDTDRPHVVARPEDEQRCAQAMYQHLLEHERWSLLDLALQDDESALLALPPLNPLRHWGRLFETMPVSRVKLTAASVPEYLAGLTAHQRKGLTRSVRKTLAAGRAEAVSSTSPASAAALLELYLALEQRSWKAAARAGISRHPARVAFFRALTGAEQPMPLRVQLLLLDDLPVAGTVTGAFGKVMHGLEMCFDQDYEPLGCGHVGALIAFREAIAAGLDELNLNGNYAYNKAHFGGLVTPTHAVQIYRVGSPPWLKAQVGALERWLKPVPVDTPAYNPERRAHERPAEVPAPRVEERAHVRSVLAALEGQGVKLDRLGGAALEAALTPAARTRNREVVA